MSEDLKFVLGSIVVVVLIIVAVAGAVKSSNLMDCRDLQRLYGEVVEIETRPFSAWCMVGDYKIESATVNTHIYIQEYLDND